MVVPYLRQAGLAVVAAWTVRAGAVLLHEIGHLVGGRLAGGSPRGLRLFPVSGSGLAYTDYPLVETPGWARTLATAGGLLVYLLIAIAAHGLLATRRRRGRNRGSLWAAYLVVVPLGGPATSALAFAILGAGAGDDLPVLLGDLTGGPGSARWIAAGLGTAFAAWAFGVAWSELVPWCRERLPSGGRVARFSALVAVGVAPWLALQLLGHIAPESAPATTIRAGPLEAAVIRFVVFVLPLLAAAGLAWRPFPAARGAAPRRSSGTAWVGAVAAAGLVAAASLAVNTYRDPGRVLSRETIAARVARHPDSIRALRLAAHESLRSEESEEAERYLRRALALRPAHPGASFDLGRLLLTAGRVDAALPLLTRAGRGWPSVSGIAGQRARAHEMRGEYGAAAHCWRQYAINVGHNVLGISVARHRRFALERAWELEHLHRDTSR